MKRSLLGIALIAFAPSSFAAITQDYCSLPHFDEIGGSIRSGEDEAISFGSCINSLTTIRDSPIVTERYEALPSQIYEFSGTRSYAFQDIRTINDATYGNVSVASNVDATSSIEFFKLEGILSNTESAGEEGEFVSTSYQLQAVDTLNFQGNDDFSVSIKVCFKLITDSDAAVLVAQFDADPSDAIASEWLLNYNHENAPIEHTCETVSLSPTSTNTEFDLVLNLVALGSVENATTDFLVKAEIDNLPSDVSCTSLSGRFPGCSENSDPDPYVNVIPEKCPSGCESSVGNPINLALGFKHERVTDYSADMLSFTRYYRSDANWYSHSLGQYWRHNFDRKVTVNGNEAELVTESGLHYGFSMSGSTWSVNAEDADLMGVFGEENGGYFFIDSSETKNIFDSTGKLTRIEYRGGKYIDLTYNGSDELIAITDQNNRNLTLTYTNGYLTQVVTPEYTLIYGQDTDGNLTTVETVEGTDSKSITYHYEKTQSNLIHALTGVTDERGIRFSTYDYDPTSGRAILSEHAGGANRFEIDYQANGNVRVKNPLNKYTTYHFETIQGMRRLTEIEGEATALCAAASKLMDYDANGWLVSKTDWEGNETSYTRDPTTGLVLTKTEGEERTTTYTYWPGTRQLKSVQVNGTNKLTEYEYDNGRRSKVTVTDTADPNNLVSRETSYTYVGSTFKVDSVTHPNGAVTKYTYNTDDLVSSVTRAFGEWYAQTTSYVYDSSKRIDSVTDIRNPSDPSDDFITKFEYDSYGRLKSTKGNFGVAGNEAVTQYFYHDNDTLHYVVMPNGTSLFYTYDNARRVKTVTSGIGADPTVIEYNYNAAGDITHEIRYRDNNLPLYKQVLGYDELSRLINKTNEIDRDSANGNDTAYYSYNKNGNLTEIENEKGHSTTYKYDTIERLVEIQDPLNVEPTKLTHNDLDQTTEVTDPRPVPTTYTYNAFGDVVIEISTDTGPTLYTYNDAGNLIQRTDARLKTVNYTHDKLNRVASIRYPTDPTNDVTYQYDISEYCANGWGRLCKVIDGSGYIEYQYDSFGRMAVERHFRDIGSAMGAYTIAYGYDLSGLPYVVLLPSGNVYVYERDANEQVSTLKYGLPNSSDPNNAHFTNIVSAAQYLPFGPPISMSFPNGVDVTRSYNQAYEITNQTVGKSGQAPLISTAYARDAGGNIIQKGTTSYVLDALDRITNDNGLLYTLDEIGNREQVGAVQYTYHTDTSRIATIDGVSITHDVVGNITNYTNNRSFTYDDAGRVATFNDGSTTTTYTYNAFNQRTAKTTNGVTTYYIYGHDGMLYGVYQGLTKLNEFIYLEGVPVAQVDTSEAITYLHTDHLNTPRKGSDALGIEVWSWDSDAFGVGEATGSTTVNLRFPGQYYDSESGLHYNWNRYYDPETGRYITSDPIGLGGGLNTFGYVNGNPLMLADPAGLIADPISLAAAAITGAAIATSSLICLANDCLRSIVQPIADAFDWAVDELIEAAFDYLDEIHLERVEDIVDDLNDQAADGYDTASITIPWPPKNSRKWTCICRVQENDVQNCSLGFGYGIDRRLGEAKLKGKAMAVQNANVSNLHHPTCKCTGPKGERVTERER